MNLALCALFGAIGLAEDFIVSCYYVAIAEKKAVRAGLISAFHTVLAVFVVASVIKSESLWPMLFYAVGGGIGCWAGVKINGKNHRTP